MEIIRLGVVVVLRHILDQDSKLVASEENLQNNNNDDQDNSQNPLVQNPGHSRKQQLSKRLHQQNKIRTENMLDLSGPELNVGIKGWLIYHQLIGLVNLTGRPLYVSILFKLLVWSVVGYALSTHFVYKFYNLHIISENYKNPIFVFISLLAIITITAQIIVSLRVHLFNLCPMFKIFNTPKLCFVKTEVLHTIGDKSFSSIFIFHIYHGALTCMLVSKSMQDFIDQFHLPTFLLDMYAIAALNTYLMGTCYMDFYIRSAFGHWLLALKSYLEHRFTSSHRHQRRIIRRRLLSQQAQQLPIDSSDNGIQLQQHSCANSVTTAGSSRYPVGQLTFDQIQRSFNNMDDHLEVLRSIQITFLMLFSLNAFLGNGALILLTYHLLSDQGNYYHGLLMLLLSIDYIFVIFLSYSGDRWIFYALSSFVQTVEDEYFTQKDMKTSESRLSSTESQTPQQLHKSLLITKKDVLFCREFLHQFENHLATPWSKLTFKTHLHILRAFVTLIAAQIIFDHEH